MASLQSPSNLPPLYKVTSCSNEIMELELSEVFSERKLNPIYWNTLFHQLVNENKNLLVSVRKVEHIGNSALSFLVTLQCELHRRNKRMAIIRYRSRDRVLIHFLSLQEIIPLYTNPQLDKAKAYLLGSE